MDRMLLYASLRSNIVSAPLLVVTKRLPWIQLPGFVRGEKRESSLVSVPTSHSLTYAHQSGISVQSNMKEFMLHLGRNAVIVFFVYISSFCRNDSGIERRK
jgi:hypothetical protein